MTAFFNFQSRRFGRNLSAANILRNGVHLRCKKTGHAHHGSSSSWSMGDLRALAARSHYETAAVFWHSMAPPTAARAIHAAEVYDPFTEGQKKNEW